MPASGLPRGMGRVVCRFQGGFFYGNSTEGYEGAGRERRMSPTEAFSKPGDAWEKGPLPGTMGVLPK